MKLDFGQNILYKKVLHNEWADLPLIRYDQVTNIKLKF